MTSPAITPSLDDIRLVAPALAAYATDSLAGDVWMRPELSPRDRCVVTVAALTAKGQAHGLPHYVGKALDQGVTAGELSEIVTHLAFYSGWMNAYAAVAPLKAAFAERGIDASQLPEVSPTLLPLDTEAEAKRSATVDDEPVERPEQVAWVDPIHPPPQG